ncbi:MAG: hypothetical protein ACI9R3_001379 [Verrucomicrobiales bacterium]|jgi:hypothetical protein
MVRGSLLTVVFSEPVEASGAETAGNYAIIADGDPVEQDGAAELQPDARTVIIAMTAPLIGRYAVAVANVSDLAGNTIAEDSSINGVAPDPGTRVFLFDFGGGAFIDKDGDGNWWDNVTNGVADSDEGELSGIIDMNGADADITLAMIRRFNGVNQSGTKDNPELPPAATLDSFFVDTELFSGLRDVFPSFKATDLDPSLEYTFTRVCLNRLYPIGGPKPGLPDGPDAPDS